MDVLVAGAIGLTISMGMLKATQVSVVSNKVVSASVAEQDLRRSIGQSLGTKIKCEHNLKTFTTNADHSLSSLKIMVKDCSKSGCTPQNCDTKPECRSERTLVTKGALFKNVLKVYEMKLKKSATNQDTFAVYYTKENLGDYKTLPKADGTAGTCTATDQTGCYSLSCNMEHTCTGTTCTECALSNCTASQGDTLLYNVKCADGLHLKGFDSNGNKVCELFPKIHKCNDGYVLRGFDADGDPVCVPHCSGGRKLFETLRYVDPDGKYRYSSYVVGNRPSDNDLFDYDPERPGTTRRFCKCLEEQGWKNGNCVTCEGNTKWVWNDKDCMTCASGGSWQEITIIQYEFGLYKINNCKCPAGFKKKKVA